jgi:predicted metal-dependent hydrolase
MHQIDVDGLIVDVVRKDIKHLHLAVYPPNGRIRVAVPLHVTDQAIRLAVMTKLSWIHRQQEKFNQQERQTPRQYVSGETHYSQGRRYRLNVIDQDGPGKIEVRNNQFLDLYIRPGSTTEQRRRVITEWYRAALRKSLNPLIEKWETAMGVEVKEWGIKQMKTRWGTCNTQAGRIWINLELAKKSPRCLEYIVVHEMVHLQERLHNDHFRQLLSRYFPQWQLIRDELNREPLAHEDWEY